MKGLRTMLHLLLGEHHELAWEGHAHSRTISPLHERAETLNRRLDEIEARLEQRRLRVLDAESGTVPREPR